MSDNLIKMLLSAEISKDSVEKIRNQIKNIEKTEKLKFEIDDISLKKATAKFTEMQKQMASATTSKLKIFDEKELKKSEAEFLKVTGSLEGSMEHLVKKYRELGRVTIEGKNFDPATESLDRFTIKVEEAEGVIKKHRFTLSELTNGEKIWLKDKLTGADKSFEIEEKRLRQSHEVRVALNKEAEAEREKNREIQKRLELYKQKMLGGDGFKGELDIFAEKQKGKFDKKALSSIRKDVEKLNVSTPDLNNKMKQLGIQFNSVKLSAAESGNVLVTALNNAYRFLRFYLVGGMLVRVVSSIREGIRSVRELDTALTELRKVTNLTNKELEDFTETAYRVGVTLGRTGTEVIKASSAFARMGFDVQQSLGLAQEALLMFNVGDGIDNVDQATTSLIASLKGFDVASEESIKKARKFNDSYNEVANNFAVDTGNLAMGVQRASAVLNQAGVNFDETLGLLTGSFEVLQNMEKSSTGLITITQRLRAMNEDGTQIEGLMPQLEKAFNDIGVTLVDTNGQLKDTFSIMKSLAEVFPTLTKNQQAYISELVSGKRQAPVLQSLMSNWETVEEVVETSINSMGSAMEENEKYLESIDGKMQRLASSTEMFWKNFVDSSTIKMFVDSLNTIIQIIDKLVNNSYGSFIVKSIALIGVISLVTKSFNFLKNSLVGTALQVALLDVAQAKLTTTTLASNSALMASPLFWGVAGATLVYYIIQAINTFTTSLKDQTEVVKKLSDELENLQSEYEVLKNKEDRTKEEEHYLKLLDLEINKQRELLEYETKRLVQQKYFDEQISFGFDSTKGGDTLERSSGAKEIENLISKIKELREQLLKTKDVAKAQDIQGQILEIETTLLSSLREMKKEIKKMGGTAPEAFIKLADSIEKVVSKNEDLNDTLDDYNFKQEDANKATSDAIDKMNAYGKILDELNSKEGLSVETKQRIMKEYDNLLPYLDDEIKLKEILMKLHEQEAEVARQGVVAKLAANNEFSTKVINSNKELYNALYKYYNGDLNNFSSLANAKAKVDGQLIQTLGRAWAKYYSSIHGTMVFPDADTEWAFYSSPEGRAYRAAYSATQGLAYKISSAMKGISTSVNFSGIGLGSYTPPAPKTSTSGSKSSTKETDAEKKAREAFQKWVENIRRSSEAIEYELALIKLDQEYALALDNKNEYIKLRIQENMLLKDLNKTYQSNINKIEAKMKTLSKTSDEYRELEGLLQQYTQGIKQNEIAILQNTQALKDYDKELRDGVISAQELVLDAVRARVRAEYEANKKIIQDKIKHLEEEKRLLREAYNARQQEKDEQKKQERLKELEERFNKISLDNSGMFEKEKLDLSQQMEQLREEIYEDSLLKEIEAQEEALDSRIEKLQQEEEALDEHFKAMEESMQEYWDEVENIMQGSQKSITDFLKEHSDEYKKAGKLQKEAFLEGWGDTIEFAKAVMDGKLKTSDEIAKTTPKPKVTTPSSSTSSSGSSSSSSSSKAITKGGKINAKGAKIYASIGGTPLNQYYKNDPIYTVLEDRNGWLRVRHHKLSSGNTGWFRKKDVKAYKKGGLVDYTGMAMVHGDKQNPEAVLNARQTETFQKFTKYLEKSPFNMASGIGKLSNGDKIINTTIGDVIVNVEKLENETDYDKLGNKVKDSIYNSIKGMGLQLSVSKVR